MSVNIRLKRDHSVVVTANLPPVRITYLGLGWVSPCDNDGKTIFYGDAYWEPVPPEHWEWEDVTEKCLVSIDKDDSAQASIIHDGLFIATFKSGYRLRKELVDFPASQDQQERRGWAFIVKRLVKL
jgi:hypothetical protein